MPRKAARRNSIRRGRTSQECEPLSKILVAAFAPGTQPVDYVCTSDSAFLIYCSTNFSNSGSPPGWGYSVSVKSTGFTSGTAAPLYIVGGGAKEVVTFRMLPGSAGFITLQTRCGANASITLRQ